MEGANSIIKRIHNLAPAIKLPLMSARLVIKKGLGPGILKGGKQARSDAIAYAVDTHSGALRQLANTKVRFHCQHGDDDGADPLPIQDVRMSGPLPSDADAAAAATDNTMPDFEADDSDKSSSDAPVRRKRGRPRKNLLKPSKTTSKATGPVETFPSDDTSIGVCPCFQRMVAFLQASLKGQDMTAAAKSCFTFSTRTLGHYTSTVTYP